MHVPAAIWKLQGCTGGFQSGQPPQTPGYFCHAAIFPKCMGVLNRLFCNQLVTILRCKMAVITCSEARLFSSRHAEYRPAEHVSVLLPSCGS